MSGAAPRVGCGAAILDQGRLLLIKRRHAPEAGRWSLVGGKVEFLESVEDAVRREALEEVGLEIELVRPLFVSELLGVDDSHWVSPVYQARAVTGEAQNREPEKIDALVWAALSDPPAPLAAAAREAIALLSLTGTPPALA